MKISLKYGDTEYGLSIPEKAAVSTFRPNFMKILDSLGDATRQALCNPLDCDRIEDLARNKAPQRIAIAVPDESRSAPVKNMLPILLDRLYSALPNLKPSDVSIIIGGGLHVPMDDEGIQKIIPPEVASGCHLVAHDIFNARFVDIGVTRRGTPVRINAEIAEADFKVVVGQIDPHQFVGFTGGAKGVVIGCAAAESIEHNHSLMFSDRARPGRIEGNPVREDIDEAGDMIGIDLAIDVVLDADYNVVELLAGRPTSVLRQGAKTCAALYGMALEDGFDIVVASCGGYPKDICLYQAQKGLNLASRAAKQHGKILLLAAAPQGVGDDTYLEYVTRFSTPQEVLEGFKSLGFKMGAHKAFLFAKTLVNYDVAVFSDLHAEILKKCQLRAADPDSILEEWVEEFDGIPRVAVVPNANATFFYPA